MIGLLQVRFFWDIIFYFVGFVSGGGCWKTLENIEYWWAGGDPMGQKDYLVAPSFVQTRAQLQVRKGLVTH